MYMYQELRIQTPLLVEEVCVCVCVCVCIHIYVYADIHMHIQAPLQVEDAPE